mgnify:CR=1 FL=1
MVFCGENCENLQRKGTLPPLLQNRCYMLCFLFSVVVNMQERRGKFILFLALAKNGKGNALFVFSLAEALGKIQNVHFPLRWTCFFVLFRISQECKFWTEEYCLQTEEYKFQTLQYNIQM